MTDYASIPGHGHICCGFILLFLSFIFSMQDVRVTERVADLTF